MPEERRGCVYLVGAGPGDAELLTIKGERLLREADVVVYDQLANPCFLSLAGGNAKLIDVGKHAGHHTLPQDEINALLKEEAEKGNRVVRLKGGDPFIFGRGGEEAQYLVEHGIRFEVVPGVTSAASVPAYAGIPVTHRDETATVTFITGHEAKTDESRIPWTQLATMQGTLVFLMGLSNLPLIAPKLMENGAPESMPVAVISHGTRGDQKTVTGSLRDITEQVSEAGVQTPALIVVGTVVNLRDRLQWFENKPLFGKRVLVTREASQAKEFADMLSKEGAIPYVLPLIRMEEQAQEIEKLRRRMQEGPDTDWIVFTSSNGVRVFMDTLWEAGCDVRVLGNVKLAAIGEKTEAALENYGLKADCVPEEYRAEALAESLLACMESPSRVLLARAYRARPVLADMLREAGCTVEEIPLYDTLTNEDARGPLREVLRETEFVTFCSASAVDAFFEMIPEEEFRALREAGQDRGRIKLVAIGPVTAQAMQRNGVAADIIPTTYTTEHMTREIGNWKE